MNVIPTTHSSVACTDHASMINILTMLVFGTEEWWGIHTSISFTKTPLSNTITVGQCLPHRSCGAHAVLRSSIDIKVSQFATEEL